MANDQHISLLLQKFASGQINQQEYGQLILYFKLSGNDDEIFAAMDAIWHASAEQDTVLTYPDTHNAYQKLISSQAYQNAKGGARVMGLWYRIAAAAVVLIVLSAGTYWAVLKKQKSVMVAALNKIGPGGNKATLTLANGKVIDLSNAGSGTLVKQHNVTVTKAANGQLVYHVGLQPAGNTITQEFNTITTPRGGQYQVDLPDGTRVWLNTASSLRFPLRFAANERKVTLTGEAYFEVVKNPHLPFRVISTGQQVEVLGTHFNVNGYTDEDAVTTTLLEGSVKVTATGKNSGSQQLVLKPNEQSVIKSTLLTKHDADVEEAVAWKNGLFLFTGKSLEEIMRQASRWYDVDVVFDDSSLKKQIFSGSISRFKNISQLLEVLESTGSVHFKIDGRRLTAMK